MSPAVAFVWLTWTRSRRGLSVCAAYGLILVIAAHVLAIVSPRAARVVPSFLLPCPFVFGYLVNALVLGREARLEARESGFPARLLTLPLPTWALVGWPMLWGIAGVAAAWLVVALGVLRPCGLHSPALLWWPVLMLAVALAWIQALVWTPFPLPGLRFVLSGPLIGVALVGPQLLAKYNVLLVPAALAVQLPLAYLVAVVGVSRARRGDVAYWQSPGWLRWPSRSATRRAVPAFASPMRGLAWFEWRRWGMTLPLLLAGLLLILLPGLPHGAEFLDMAAQAGLHIVPPLLLHELGGLGVMLLAVVLLPPFLASACAYELGRLPGRDRARDLSSFLATRPVSAATIVRAKWVAAARSTLAAWGVVAAGLLLWLALSGHGAEVAAQWQALRQRHGEGPAWYGASLLMLGSVCLTWLQLVQGLWTGQVPRRWGLMAGALGLGGLVGMAGLAQWLSRSPERWQSFAVWLPWLAAAVVALKALAAGWALRRVVLRRLFPGRAVAAGLGAWLAVAVVVAAATYRLSPDEGRSIPGALLGVALVLPLTRLALALLALDRARHH